MRRPGSSTADFDKMRAAQNKRERRRIRNLTRALAEHRPISVSARSKG